MADNDLSTLASVSAASDSPNTRATPSYAGFLSLMVRVEPLVEGRYRATVEGDLRGSQQIDFTLPGTEAERSQWLAQFRDPTDPMQEDRWRALERFGSELFTAIFRGETLANWRVHHDIAVKDDLLLRLVLELGDPALEQLPWEALYDPLDRFFLARDEHTCILRHPHNPEAPRAQRQPRRPLRILALISAPSNVPELDVAGEKALLEEALGPLIERDEVDLTWIDGRDEPATLPRLTTELQRTAASNPYNIFHYIGHARWDETLGEGVLLLEDSEGQAAPATASMLGELLRGDQLRLAVLNACDGSRLEQAQPFRSVAAALTSGADVPAVIANQIPISDKAAKAFAGAFYGALATRHTVEGSMVVARRAMSVATPRIQEWVASILFSQFADEPMRLLPPRFSRRRDYLLFTLLLTVLTLLMGVMVITMLRVLGPYIGGAFQIGIWGLALLIAYFQRAFLDRARYYLASGLLLGTLLVAIWFLWQPVLPLAPPPPSFGLTLNYPSPYGFITGQIPVINYITVVEGQAINLPPGHHLWVLVQEEGSDTWVAGEPVEWLVEEPGRWLVRELVVGPPVVRPVGEQRYLLQPVLVDEAGHRFLQQRRTGFWRYFHPDFLLQPRPRLQSAPIIRR